MADTTITINASTNPTYGGHVDFDGTSTYDRDVLSDGNPTVEFDTPNIKRAFAFFDLSTDPTSGGTITKVELLAEVLSVSGTDLINVCGGNSATGGTGGPGPGVDPAALADSGLYSECDGNGDFGNLAQEVNPSAGAIVIDLGANAITEAAAAILADTGFFAGIALADEGTAGSVVFKSTVGFGLRITYTPAASGPSTPAKAAAAGIMMNRRRRHGRISRR